MRYCLKYPILQVELVLVRHWFYFRCHANKATAPLCPDSNIYALPDAITLHDKAMLLTGVLGNKAPYLFPFHGHSSINTNKFITDLYTRTRRWRICNHLSYGWIRLGTENIHT